MKPLSIDSARKILDLSGGQSDLSALGELQLRGAVALQHSLANSEVGFGYLADEVGMGKTYIALSVVALLRYFNPSLRVLYICPSKNVQEKWIREYQSFVRNNVKVSHGRIRTLDNQPATPFVSCTNLESLIHASSSGYYGDFFIGGGSFSFPLDNDSADGYQSKLENLKRLVPRWSNKDLSDIDRKDKVKNEYARALNEILPKFDLVVIDEAHNFKRGFDSSSRNRVLSQVLGFSKEAQLKPRVEYALLLSATPYDRSIDQLRNQLAMVGKAELLPSHLQGSDGDQFEIRRALKRFMVRRLNTLEVNGTDLTRNQYRHEWRKGPQVEIALDSDETKLVTALVQKRVGDALSSQHGSITFQTGLLASFESFAQSALSQADRFDGESSDGQREEARDRHVIDSLVSSYRDAGLGYELPHPKMDVVSERLSKLLFGSYRKQLVFVRRVRSVDELKNKLDLEYNEWIKTLIQEELGATPARDLMSAIWHQYSNLRLKELDSNIAGELERVSGGGSSDEDELGTIPAKNDTFFAWFFRGETPDVLKAVMSDWPTPDGLRKSLSAKSQQSILLFEQNWARFLCRTHGHDLDSILATHMDELGQLTSRYWAPDVKNDKLALFTASQAAFVHWFNERYPDLGLTDLLNLLKSSKLSNEVFEADLASIEEQYRTYTFFDAIDDRPPLRASLMTWRDCFVDSMATKCEPEKKKAAKMWQIHSALLGVTLRTGHGIIDLYLTRLKQGKQDLNNQSRAAWMNSFGSLLARQMLKEEFSTFRELSELTKNLELVIKTSIPEILDAPVAIYRRLLGQKLTPVSPIIGAHGETGDRAPQARKFRLPGYPLALISTDVFQEGEDLHTFCDSVVHFGIPASPVSLEQKAGRVDRVNSKAQRHLQELSRAPSKLELIQVSFPHIKQSIEYLQVRNACRNLNEYLDSLHDFQSSKMVNSDEIVAERELLDQGDIPDPVLCFLESPYDVKGLLEGQSLVPEIEFQEQRMDHIRRTHIKEMERWLRERDTPNLTGIFLSEELETLKPDHFCLSLRSARSSDQFLASLSFNGTEEILEPSSTEELIELMRTHSWQTFHRTVAWQAKGAPNRFQLISNAELLVNEDQQLLLAGLDRLITAFSESEWSNSYLVEKSQSLQTVVRDAESAYTRGLKQLGVQIQWEMSDASKAYLTFRFESETDVERRQLISIEITYGFVIFRTFIAPAGFAVDYSVRDLIRLTWERNLNTDLVEFLIDPQGALRGRVVLPFAALSQEHFIYCAHTLAAEADRLEFLLSEKDEF